MNRRSFVKAFGKGAAAVSSLSALSLGTRAFAADKSTADKPTGKVLYDWKMVTTWPKGFPGLGTGAEALAERLGILSGGRIRVRVYGAGELVPAMGVFDAVTRGTTELGHGASYYWRGKSEAAQFFAAVPFGLNAQEMHGWLRHGGGQKLWDELYAQFGLKGFAAGNTGVQMAGWFNKEIRVASDFRGLKIRMPGLGGDVLKKLGAAVVNIPGGEIFQALKSGAIDASEWVGPYNDLAFGLHKAAKYYYWPGWHEPGTTLELMINKKVYDGLPSDLKAAVEAACAWSNEDMLAEYTARNSSALVQLVETHKVQLKKMPSPVMRELGRLSRETLIEVTEKDPIAKRVHDSFVAFRGESMKWNQMSEEAYGLARALTYRK